MRSQLEIIPSAKIIILLDACRFDVFKQVYDDVGLDFPLEEVTSPASQTMDWYLRTFAVLSPEETTLVGGTVQPWGPHLRELLDRWHKKIPLWMNGEGKRDRAWSPHHRTTVTNLIRRGLQEHELNPDKRILIHCLPPHLPFYGDEGWAWWRRTLGEEVNYNQYFELQRYGKRNGWDELRGFYRESVGKALREITLFNYPAKTVVTSDHGEFTGENNLWKHSFPDEDNYETLRNVPYMEIQP